MPDADASRFLNIRPSPKYKCQLHGNIGTNVIEIKNQAYTGAPGVTTGLRCGICFKEFIEFHIPAAEPVYADSKA